jgi:para-nitrobenzyl esterase
MALGEIVNTKSGPVQGVEHASSRTGEGSIQVFRGIPYAEAPVGERRFKPPVPRTPWTDTLVAEHAGPLAPQNPSPLESMLGAGQPPIGDDCLSLNIWTPQADGKGRPVLFWIHGGAFVTGTGSTPWYDGSAFARHHDVVVVTINYRLGALGFLHLADLFGDEWAGSGNLGILDQSLALRWTSENIAAFGGDPGNITIFGESAGGMSVATQLGLPASQGLFRRAIAQSGAAGHVHTRETATKVAERVLEVLDVRDPAALQQVPTADILAAQEKVNLERSDIAGGGLPFMPCVDGTVLPVGPQQAVRDGHARGVDLLLGTNLDEMTLFTLMDPALSSLDDGALARRFGGLFGEERAMEALDAYRKDRSDATPGDLWNAALSDRVFRVPAVRLADAQHTNGSTYVYLFTWESTAFDGRLRSCHALEIPFVWDNLDQTGVAFLTGPITDEMRALATTMNEAWAAFARTGNPSTPTLADWPMWDPETRPTMVINTEAGVELDPMGHEIEVWSELL